MNPQMEIEQVGWLENGCAIVIGSANYYAPSMVPGYPVENDRIYFRVGIMRKSFDIDWLTQDRARKTYKKISGRRERIMYWTALGSYDDFC
ncbi:hypothetical protein AYK24_06695 [Thermoplasmatales archaeon SG8-52-4]|nr:MAG: hypothetical protein AYK24_06695 [Thermoplasmatales archaeon SG8-52-4]